MNDFTTYQIKVRRQVSASDINASTPIHLSVIDAAAAGTRLSVFTDQSGLVGLLRHLHGLGYVFLSITRSGG